MERKSKTDYRRADEGAIGVSLSGNGDLTYSCNAAARGVYDS